MSKIQNYIVRPVEKSVERAFMARWHYSKKTVPNSCIILGCFSGDKLVGVATFGRIINCVPLFKNISNRSGLELNRLAMVDEAPKNSESWFLMTCIRLLRKKYKWLQFIHTWADGLRCQGGTIYKACGFLYLRKISIGSQYELPDGSVIHSIAFNKNYLRKYSQILKNVPGSREKVARIFGEPTKELTGGFNYNFIYLIDKSLKKDLVFIPKPYEINMRQSYKSSMPGNQPGGGGAIPTLTL